MHWLNPDYLPEISGIFERFLFNLHGEADGMVMSDGTEVHFPPHMADEVCACIRADERTKVKVRGIRQPAGGVIAAVAIETIDGRRIVDKGPPVDKKAQRAARDQMYGARRPTEISGVVGGLLHGPKGEVRGLLLEDGRSGRFPSCDPDYLLQLWLTKSPVILRGEEIAAERGVVIAVHEIGTSRDRMHSLDRKPEPDKPAEKSKAETTSAESA
jgi:hypothetical protein